MTKIFSNLNLDIKSIRKKDRQIITETDRQTEIMNREQREYLSLRTKLAISLNWGKINVIELQKKKDFLSYLSFEKKKLGVGWEVSVRN